MTTVPTVYRELELREPIPTEFEKPAKSKKFRAAVSKSVMIILSGFVLEILWRLLELPRFEFNDSHYAYITPVSFLLIFMGVRGISQAFSDREKERDARKKRMMMTAFRREVIPFVYNQVKEIEGGIESENEEDCFPPEDWFVEKLFSGLVFEKSQENSKKPKDPKEIASAAWGGRYKETENFIGYKVTLKNKGRVVTFEAKPDALFEAKPNSSV